MKKIKFQLLREGLSKHDLVGLVNATFTIDKFQPKFGEEKDVIVTAFKCASESAADDLADFIEKGYYQIPLQDTETSFSPDTDGKWLVFIETDRTFQFPKLMYNILKDIERLTDKINWNFIPLGKSMPVNFSVANIEKHVILSSSEYVKTQSDKEIKERIEFLKKY